MWLAWMDRHPDTANQWYDQGHSKVVELFKQEHARGKRDGFLGLPYWLPDNGSISTIPEASISPTGSRATSSSPVVIQENRSKSPLPTRDIGLIDISIHDTLRTSSHVPHSSSSGSSQQTEDQAVSESQEPNRPISFVRPEDIMDTTADTGHAWRSLPAIESDTDDEVLGTLESSLATSVREIREPETYSLAQRSENWTNWKKAIDEELASLEENNMIIRQKLR
ncbi:hypothetical protein HOY80DRAFT_1089626 [Tuber brumale]|nr:hypothetical protein HOY80DRAFT_1089626 [Tuber brumale]